MGEVIVPASIIRSLTYENINFKVDCKRVMNEIEAACSEGKLFTTCIFGNKANLNPILDLLKEKGYETEVFSRFDEEFVAGEFVAVEISWE